ncbi:MAG: UDP-N-acetylglucosamine 1-carboxyvinyltransferase [Candidatus Roizmanbacteria bacterium]|nr:UDP-N-acetylglucosamine 1-carboxyvinyltransferase [Candidatus Roizmanbacteria bacterium]
MFYVINGGAKLKGEVEVSGAKNVALKMIVAALLLKGMSRIENVPKISDVISLIDIINRLGGHATFVDKNVVEVENTLTHSAVSIADATRTRVSFLLIAPLLYTFKKVTIPNPGGCRLGARPVDRLVESLRTLGAEINYDSDDGCYHASYTSLHCGTITFEKKTHTGTELAIMASACIEGETIIQNSALEPEIDELIYFFNLAGAKVFRRGDDIVVNGKDTLTSVHATVSPDRNEAISFLVLSALTNGSVGVRGVQKKTIKTFLTYVEKADLVYEEKSDVSRIKKRGMIQPTNIVTAPHPGFMTDWQPLWAILMTQAHGVSTIHETVFEDRFGYVNELNKFGAHLAFWDPKQSNTAAIYQFETNEQSDLSKQAIRISGPTKLHNASARMTDLRAGACLVLAALLAEGKSVISGAEQIERGYEQLLHKLRTIGASIDKIED